MLELRNVYGFEIAHLPWYMRRRAQQAYLRYLSWNTVQLDLEKELEKTFQVLSTYLEKSKYFFGDTVCSADAVVFGYLAAALYLQLPDNIMSETLQKFPLLVGFVDNILETYLGKFFFVFWKVGFVLARC